MSKEQKSSNPFRADLVAVRRKMLGLSQSDLAEKMNVSQGTLSKIEKGLKPLSDDHIERLCAVLQCPTSFFYQPIREVGLPISAHAMFRKRASAGQKVIDRLIADLNVRLEHIRVFLDEVDFEPELPLPSYDIDDFNGDAEQIADFVRRAWYVPNGPIKNLTDYAERAGCIVIHCDFEEAKIDGVSYRLAYLPPVIFLNTAQPADRMRFSLAHEIGHLIMHSYPTPTMEEEANQFAAELLMPKDDISKDLQDLTIQKAAYLKPEWQASMASLIYRAKQINAITPNKAEYLWRQMATNGFRSREPAGLDFPAEKPTLLNALINNLVGELGYTEEDLIGTLHLYYEELSAMYGLKKNTGLRLVK